MQFALVLTGQNAPTPAPRIDAIPSISGIGLWDENTQEIWEAKTSDIKEALPPKYRRCHISGPWHDKAARVDQTGRLKGGAPYCTLRNTRHAYIATVYLLPISGKGKP